jgi:regulator of protease activity HflC (stomatin/prohibitin superfamily)
VVIVGVLDILFVLLIPGLFIGGLLLLSGIRVLYQFQRGVVFTLGKFSSVKDPGLNFVWPVLQSMHTIDMRIITADVPRQEAITKDNIPVLVNTVVYFKVTNPADAVIKIEDYYYAVKQLTQAALRDVVGNSDLDTVLTEREKLATAIKKNVDDETSAWGIDIESIKIQEIELPAEMKRAMAKQAEAEREKRAVIIQAEGELTASENLRKAAENIARSPGAMQLRTLQTIRDIAADPSEKIVLFMPTDVAEVVKKAIGK